MKILITGGCGYVGSRLVPKLLLDNHYVHVVDAQWFGNFLSEDPNLKVEKKSIFDIEQNDLKDVEVVIHLANIANDPSVELDPSLSWNTNVLGTMHLLELSKKAEIQLFLFSSSGSVYGVKEEEKVTEELELVPISLYNKTKMIAERVVKSYEAHFRCISIRPATVCGYSPRMRLDVLINMFVYQAYAKHEIDVFGGNQVRPNIHIDDLVDVFTHFLTKPNLKSGAYNAGFENIAVKTAAEKVSEIIPARLNFHESNDPRSYRQDSTKLIDTGFEPKRSVEIAIQEILYKLDTKMLVDDDRWYTVKQMKKLGMFK